MSQFWVASPSMNGPWLSYLDDQVLYSILYDCKSSKIWELDRRFEHLYCLIISYWSSYFQHHPCLNRHEHQQKHLDYLFPAYNHCFYFYRQLFKWLEAVFLRVKLLSYLFVTKHLLVLVFYPKHWCFGNCFSQVMTHLELSITPNLYFFQLC